MGIREVLSWDLGDCRSQPVVSFEADRATFDFAQPRRTRRFTYRGGTMQQADVATAPPPPGQRAVTPPIPKPAAAREQGTTAGPTRPAMTGAQAAGSPPPGPAAGLPSGDGREQHIAPAAVAAGSKSKPAAPAPAAPAPAPPRPLEFEPEPIQPIRIVLDR